MKSFPYPIVAPIIVAGIALYENLSFWIILVYSIIFLCYIYIPLFDVSNDAYKSDTIGDFRNVVLKVRAFIIMSLIIIPVFLLFASCGLKKAPVCVDAEVLEIVDSFKQADKVKLNFSDLDRKEFIDGRFTYVVMRTESLIEMVRSKKLVEYFANKILLYIDLLSILVLIMLVLLIVAQLFTVSLAAAIRQVRQG